MSEDKTNPKCSICRTYFIPTLKSSGQLYKCCDRCRDISKKKQEENKCEHDKQRNRCKDCGGASICEHNKIRSQCRDCGGSSFCEHNRRRNECRNCGGVLFCEHNKIRSQCRDCGSSLFCEHNRRRRTCRDCGGSSFCEHNRRRNTCKNCEGASICEHNKIRSQCRDCNLSLYLVHLQRGQINRCFKSSTLDKNKHSIEYLGCDIETFINLFQKKMDYFNEFIATNELMTYDNIHIDHIKPVSKFNLDNEDEFLDCCNYTNLQPLLSKDNLEKSNKWDESNETFWKNNIINKEYYEIYII